MKAHRVLTSGDNSIFYQLPSGKPNPHVKRAWPGPDNRERVVQMANKGPLCFYYACNMIRDRIGKASPTLDQKREFEKDASLWRKSVTRICADHPGVRPDDIQEIQAVCTQLINKYWTGDPCAWLKLVQKEMPFFIHFDVKDFKRAPRLCLYFYMTDKYGFECSKWHPKKDDAMVLQEELKRHGPLMVGGYFGNSRPEKEKCVATLDPLSQDKRWSALKNPPILTWKKKLKAKTFNPVVLAHAVVVVGVVRTEKEEWVYFADPNDTSMPGRGRQIYRISYKELCLCLISRAGYSTKVGYNSRKTGYAVYNPNFKQQAPSLTFDLLDALEESEKTNSEDGLDLFDEPLYDLDFLREALKEEETLVISANRFEAIYHKNPKLAQSKGVRVFQNPHPEEDTLYHIYLEGDTIVIADPVYKKDAECVESFLKRKEYKEAKEYINNREWFLSSDTPMGEKAALFFMEQVQKEALKEGVDTLFSLYKNPQASFRSFEKKALFKLLNPFFTPYSFEVVCKKYLSGCQVNQYVYRELVQSIFQAYGFNYQYSNSSQRVEERSGPLIKSTSFIEFLQAVNKYLDLEQCSTCIQRAYRMRYIDRGKLTPKELIESFSNKEFDLALQFLETLPKEYPNQWEYEKNEVFALKKQRNAALKEQEVLKRKQERGLRNARFKAQALGGHVKGVQIAPPCHLY